jgi:hypothetical protein
LYPDQQRQGDKHIDFLRISCDIFRHFVSLLTKQNGH